jgi:hypothetical protein
MNEFVVKAASAQASVEVSSRLSGFLTGLTNNEKAAAATWTTATSGSRISTSRHHDELVLAALLPSPCW